MFHSLNLDSKRVGCETKREDVGGNNDHVDHVLQGNPEAEAERDRDRDRESTMDLDRRVIYAAAATSLDSWDIENLRYIRQISRAHPDGIRTGSGDLDTASYISEKIENEELDNLDLDNLDCIQLPCLHLQTDQDDVEVEADIVPTMNGTGKGNGNGNGTGSGSGPGPGFVPGFIGLLTHKDKDSDQNNNSSNRDKDRNNNGAAGGTGTQETSQSSKNDKDKDKNNSGYGLLEESAMLTKLDEKEMGDLTLLKMRFESDNGHGHGGTSNTNTFSHSGDSAAALDNCYLLDVVTVRNESVLAFTPNKKRSAGLNNSVGSSSSISSASSTSSCSIHLPSDKCIDVDADVHFMGSNSDIYQCEPKKVERDFFDFSLDEESVHATINPKANLKIGMGLNNLNSYARRNTTQSGSVSNSNTNSNLTHHMMNMERRSRLPGSARDRENNNEESRNNPPVQPRLGLGRHCPFCDHENNPFFSCEQSVNLEDVSMQVTIGGEPPAAPPRSPSPYYVRLRRDLLTTLTPPPHHLSTNRPRNFSVNTHGQLTIDYSSNWLGLENYVKNLKR